MDVVIINAGRGTVLQGVQFMILQIAFCITLNKNPFTPPCLNFYICLELLGLKLMKHF